MEIDLADRLDDLICTFDKAVSDGPSDIFVAIGGWLVLAVGIFLTIGYIINNLRSNLSPANSVSTLDTKLNGSKKDICNQDNSDSSQHVETSNDIKYSISANTDGKHGNFQKSTTSDKKAKEELVSIDETSKLKKNFDALDPPVFTITKEHTNGSLPTGRNEISSPSGSANGDSDFRYAKDSIENEVGNIYFYHCSIQYTFFNL